MTAFCCAAGEGNRRSRFGTSGAPPHRLFGSNRDPFHNLVHLYSCEQPSATTTGDTSQHHATSATGNTSHKVPPTSVTMATQSQVFPAGLSTNSRRASAHNPYAATNGTSAVTSASARGNNPYQVMPPPRRYSLVIPTRPVTGSMNGSSQKEKPRAATGTRP
jgi:hypothetical protein